MECTDDADAASGADPPVPRGARAAYAARAPPGSLLAAARGAHGRAAAARGGWQGRDGAQGGSREAQRRRKAAA